MKEDQASSIITSTILERGPVLPIGIADPTGKLHKDISIRPWRMKEERELGEIRDKNKDANLASYVSMVLGTMCTRLGPHDLTEMDSATKRLIIGQMFMADVFYAYVWLRIQSLGSEFPMVFTPPWSAKELKINADLLSIETTCVDKYEDACWEYELKNQLEIRGKKTKKFNMGPQRWQCLESCDITKGSTNQGETKQIMIMSSIIGCDSMDVPLVLAQSEIDEMTKIDLERMTYMIDQKALGPKMAIEGTHVGREYNLPIDWGYDHFFGVSSV